MSKYNDDFDWDEYEEDDDDFEEEADFDEEESDDEYEEEEDVEEVSNDFNNGQKNEDVDDYENEDDESSPSTHKRVNKQEKQSSNKEKKIGGFLKKKDESAKEKKRGKAKPEKEKKVYGLKKKEKKTTEHKTGSPAKLIGAGIAVAAIIGVAGIGLVIMNGRVGRLNQSNQNLTQQIANQSMNVYTAKRDIKKGDAIITSGDNANVDYSQVYTSLSADNYITMDTTGYAQVDIAAGMPIMANDVGDTNPIQDQEAAVEAVREEYTAAKTIPYKITADFVDTDGKTLAASRDLTLDAGANEKAFNTEAESIDGYVLKSIQVDGDGVHAFGVSEKSMKQGIVSMYYFTTKAGWGRHEIKGNIRVTYTYIKKDDPTLDEEEVEDVMDDSAWIPEQTAEETATSANASAGASATDYTVTTGTSAEEGLETADTVATETATIETETIGEEEINSSK